jgi:hypothetical protein
MDQERAALLESLNFEQFSRWRAACEEWYDVYNPHIADLTAMHREQMLFDIAKRPALANEAAYLTPTLRPFIHDDAARLLYDHLGVRLREDNLKSPFDSFYDMHQDARRYNIEAAIADIADLGNVGYERVGDLIRDRHLLPRHMRILLDMRPEHHAVVRLSLGILTYNPLRDSRQSQNDAAMMITTWRRDARVILRALYDVVAVEPLVRVVAAYLWEPRSPAALVA